LAFATGTNIGSVKRAWREAALVCGLALAIAATTWLIRPTKVPLRAATAVYDLELAAALISPADARTLYDAGSHLFIDTRPVGTTTETIPGALAVREASFDDDLYAHMEFLYPEDPVVLFGDGNLLIASAVAARLLERDFADVTIMGGDLESWRRMGGPLTATEDRSRE
jgi:hypothetical protein